MGWPLLGQWDRETTPPGANMADLPAICAALCKAINQREKYSFYYGGVASGTETAFTYKQGSSKTYPTAADFAPTTGTRNALNGAIVRGLLSQMKGAIEDMVDGFNSRFWTDSNFTARWDVADLWAAASTGLDAWDLSAPVTKADNWLILKNALNQLRYIKPALAGIPVTTGNAYIDDSDDISDLLGFPYPTTVAVADVINCATELLVTPLGIGVRASVSAPGGVGASVYRCLSQTLTWTCPAFVGTALHTPYTAVVPAVGTNNSTTLEGGGSISGSRSYSSSGSVAPSASLSITVNFEPNATGNFLLTGGFGDPTDINQDTFVEQYTTMGHFASSKPGTEPDTGLILYVDLASFLEDQT